LTSQGGSITSPQGNTGDSTYSKSSNTQPISVPKYDSTFSKPAVQDAINNFKNTFTAKVPLSLGSDTPTGSLSNAKSGNNMLPSTGTGSVSIPQSSNNIAPIKSTGIGTGLPSVVTVDTGFTRLTTSTNVIMGTPTGSNKLSTSNDVESYLTGNLAPGLVRPASNFNPGIQGISMQTPSFDFSSLQNTGTLTQQNHVSSPVLSHRI